MARNLPLCKIVNYVASNIWKNGSSVHSVSRRYYSQMNFLSAVRCSTLSIRCSSYLPANIEPVHRRKSSTAAEVKDSKPRSGLSLTRAKYGDPSQVLANLSAEDAKRLKVLKLEYDVFYSTGVKVPDQVTDENWVKLLLDCKSVSARKNYYNYLFKTEKVRINEKAKHERRAAEQEEIRRVRLEKAQESGQLFKNTFLLHIQSSTMNKHYYNNLYYSMINGPHLLFDFSFEHTMKEQELKSLGMQIQLCHGLNKISPEPFHLHFCNVQPGSFSERLLQGCFGDLADTPLTISSKHYLDLYPKEKLVYLSPNAPTCMGDHFDVDDVLIIGAIVDKSICDPLTYARAKKENIRTVRFPLDKYVKWTQGKKSLNINHVVNILLEFKKSGDWKKSLLTSLPTRKISKEDTECSNIKRKNSNRILGNFLANNAH